MENKKRKLEEARIGKTGNKIMKRARTGKWVVTAMLGLIVIGTTTVDVGAEQSGEQEVAVEESVAQDEGTVLTERVSWKANTVDQVTVEIDKQSNEKDQDPLKDYTIVWGDTLWAISLSTGTSVEELVELNNIVNPDLIYAGDVLLLADGTSIEVTPEHVSGTQEDSTQDVTKQETSKQETDNKETSVTEGNGTNVSDNTQTGTDKDGDTVTEDDKDEGNFVGEKPKDEKDDEDVVEDDEDVVEDDEEELDVIDEEVVNPETEVELEETEPEVQEPEDSGEVEVEEPTVTPVEPEEDPEVDVTDPEVQEPVDEEQEVVVTTQVETITEKLGNKVIRRGTNELPVGEERVVQEGNFGQRVQQFLLTFHDGVQFGDRELIRDEVVLAPVDKIVEFGTYVEPNPVITTSTRTETENLPFERVTLGNPEMWDGDTEVVQTGSFGKVVREYKVTYKDGVEVSSELVDETRTEPVNEVIHLGTKPAETTKTRTETEVVPFETETRNNSDMFEGETRVVQEGVNGVLTTTFEQTYIRGEFDSEKQVSSEITKQPVNKIIEVGTKKKPVITTDTRTETYDIEFDVEVIEVTHLPVGQERVEVEGQNGQRELVYEQTFEDGVLVNEELLSDTVTREPVTKVVYLGVEPETPVNPTLPPSEREVGYTEKGNINNHDNVDPNNIYGHLGEEEYVIPYETVYVENPLLEEGQEEILLEGVNGTGVNAYEVTILGGGDYQRTLVYKYMRQNPVNRVVVVREIP